MRTVKRLLGYKCNTEKNIEMQCQGKITITNLDNSLDKKEIIELFKPFGNIITCEIENDKENNNVETACIVFDNEKSAENAVNKMNGSKVKNNEINVKLFENNAVIAREPKFPEQYTHPKEGVVDSTDDDDDLD